MHTLRVALAGRTLVLALAFSAAACGGTGDTAGDSQTAAVDPAATATADAGAASTAAGADTTAGADQEFLRMFADHHQGLIAMSQQAMERGSTEQVKAKAHELHQKQDAEQKEMLAMLQRDFGVSHQPSVMPSNQAMADSLSRRSGEDYDMAYNMNVIAHHREGIDMIDRMLPRLSNPQVRQMAERMRAEQQADIQELEGKMQH